MAHNITISCLRLLTTTQIHIPFQFQNTMANETYYYNSEVTRDRVGLKQLTDCPTKRMHQRTHKEDEALAISA